MASTLTRLAGMQDVPLGDSPAHPINDPEAQAMYNVTARPTRASIPVGRRLSRKSITSLKSTVTSPADDEDVPPLPSGPNAFDPSGSSNGAGYTATKSSLAPNNSQQQQHGTWAGHSSRQEHSHLQHHDDDDSAEPQEEEEIPWGPTHPCFPHPNPHVPRDSPEYDSTRVIRVQRDWLIAGDAYPQLQNVYPEILAEWLDEAAFRALIEEINTRLREAFQPASTRAILDAVLGVATGFVSDDLGLTGVKRGIRSLESWMRAWNTERERERSEIRLVPLRRTGFMNLDFVVPDPQIDVVADDVDGDGEGQADGMAAAAVGGSVPSTRDGQA